MSETCYLCDATQDEHSTHTRSVGQTTSLAYQLTKAQPLPNVSTHNFINPQPRQLTISSAHNRTNPSTYQPFNSRPHQITVSSSHQPHQPINSSTHQLTSTSTHDLTSPQPHQLTNAQPHQPTTSQSHNLINSQTPQSHQLKILNYYLLFYNNVQIFAAF